MQYFLRAVCFGAAVLFAAAVVAQSPAQVQKSNPASELPDEPQPQMAVLEQAQQPAQNDSGAQDQQNKAQDQQNGSQSSSQPAAGSQQPAQQESEQSQYEKAQQQIKQQEKQRIFGILPSFNTSFTRDVAPLTIGQKMKLAFRQSIDPYTFAQAALFGGYRELGSDYAEYGWGASGYFKRMGSAYADSFVGNMIGNGLLPGWWHQDPRYFRLGHGNVAHRAFYAAFSALRCKHDGTERWEPNYSNVIGNLIAGGISNVYYPENQRGWEHSINNGLVNTAVGMIGSEIQEFTWDIAKRFQHKIAQQIDAGQPQPDQKKKP